MIYIFPLVVLFLFIFSLILSNKIILPSLVKIPEDQVILSKLLFSSYVKQFVFHIFLLSIIMLGIIALSYLPVLLKVNNSFYSSHLDTTDFCLSMIFSLMIILHPAETLVLWYSQKHLSQSEFQLLISYEYKLTRLNFSKTFSRVIYLIGLLFGLVGNCLIWGSYTCLTPDSIYYNSILENSPHNYSEYRYHFRSPSAKNYKYEDVLGFYITSYPSTETNSKEIWFVEMNDRTIIPLFDLSSSQVMRILSLTGLEKVEPLPDRLK